jgi:hypothetical protein
VIYWNCKHCGEPLEAPESLAGCALECQRCGTQARAPRAPDESKNIAHEDVPRIDSSRVAPIPHRRFLRQSTVLITCGIVLVLALSCAAWVFSRGGSVEGDAFISFKSGQSEVIRGMTVRCYLSKIDAQTALPLIAACLEGSNALKREKVFPFAAPIDDGGFWTDRDTAIALGEKLQGARDQINSADVIELMHRTRGAFNRCQQRDVPKSQYATLKAVFGGSALQAIEVTTATTGVDGHFRMDNLKPGDYVLVAHHSTSFGEIYWAIPIVVHRLKTLRMDLFNQNAQVIANQRADGQ